MTRRFLSGPAIAVLALLAALAAPLVWDSRAFAADGDVYETISPSQLIKLIENRGDQAKTSGDDTVVWTTKDGILFAIQISEKEDSLIVLYYDSDLKADDVKINKWNKDKAFSKAYLDKEGDAFLELDLDLEGGVTEDNMLSFFKLCEASAKGFEKEMK
ncbi:MAG: YbjN domain-containing protein [Deltaproteobacteria bacterium]|jgi:hypothetical protein|nr:YbjN domain-containing protein [Deltaproteobacteria bacterium]